MKRYRNLQPSPQLAQLFAIGRGEFIGWGESDLAKILLAQLQAPLLASLKPSASEVQSIIGKANSVDPVLPERLGDLLAHPSPPLSLLRLAKDYAKSADSGPDPLPPA